MARKFYTGIDMGSQRIVNVGDPSGPQDVATKAYTDATARGLDWKVSARAATTGAVTLSGPGAAIDGVTLASGDRVLVKDQASGSENGIYVFNGAASALTRATDADSDAEVTSGMAVTVTEGTANGDKVFVLTTNDPITLGTTALAFTTVGGGGGSYTAGAGLTLTGDAFAVGAGTGIVVNADDVAIDPNVVPRRYAANVGDGSSTAITITHNLGTRDLHVTVYDAATPWATVECDVERSSVNEIILRFATAPASAAYRVVIS